MIWSIVFMSFGVPLMGFLGDCHLRFAKKLGSLLKSSIIIIIIVLLSFFSKFLFRVSLVLLFVTPYIICITLLPYTVWKIGNPNYDMYLNLTAKYDRSCSSEDTNEGKIWKSDRRVHIKLLEIVFLYSVLIKFDVPTVYVQIESQKQKCLLPLH